MNTPKPKPPRLTCCRMSYSPVYQPAFSSRVFLEDKTHNLHLPAVARHSSRPKVGLWWRVTSNTMAGKPAVVRHWSSRRMRHAILEALKEKGFDEAGKKPAGENLTGILDLVTLPGIVKARFEEVKMEAGMVIEHVVSLCRRQAVAKEGTGLNRGKWQQPGKLGIRRDKPLIRRATGSLPMGS